MRFENYEYKEIEYKIENGKYIPPEPEIIKGNTGYQLAKTVLEEKKTLIQEPKEFIKDFLSSYTSTESAAAR